MDDFIGWFIAAAGVFTICGAVFNWEWFMGNYKARFWVKILGRSGARVFYFILGVVILGLGLLMAFGTIPISRT